jgi:hypothetical protein
MFYQTREAGERGVGLTDLPLGPKSRGPRRGGSGLSCPACQWVVLVLLCVCNVGSEGSRVRV